jgi:hypothetical protein
MGAASEIPGCPLKWICFGFSRHKAKRQSIPALRVAAITETEDVLDRWFACPVVASHPLRLAATGTMRFLKRLPQARELAKPRLFAEMRSFEQLEKRIAKIPENKGKGDAFEVLGIDCYFSKSSVASPPSSWAI